jgi:hypothetical protein
VPKPAVAFAFALALLYTAPQAQDRGAGSGETATALPAERSAGPREEMAERSAGPQLPPSTVPESVTPAGDFVRSRSSADVREARRQDSPDLEFVPKTRG